MPNDYLDKVTLNGTTYDIKDTVSGYTSNVGTVTGVKINATTKSPNASGTVDLGTVVTSETDPTVPAWAKASSKPTYTASEVGAVPTSRTVNGKALSSNITLSAADVGALPDSTTIPTVVDTYSSTGTDAVSGKGVAAALSTLDSSIAVTTGQAISAITISDGKITGSSKISVGDANQNAFSNIKIGSSTIAADTTTDTVELVAGGLVSLTADTANDKVTISASYTETDPTVPSWAKASTKPTYNAEEIQYQASTQSGPFGSDDTAGSALDTANDLFISLGASIVNLEATKSYCVTYGATVNTSELAQAMSDTNNFIFLKVSEVGNVRYIPSTYADIESDGISFLEFTGQDWYYEYNIGDGTWTSSYQPNTDTKVTNTLATTTKYYVTGTSSSSTNTGTQVFDSGIYATTTTGQLNATTYKVNEQVTLQWNSTDSCLDFIFA